MKLRRDVAFSFLSSFWSAAIALAAVPAYIHFLGIEAYGLVGFFATTQALLQLLDMGLSPTVNREVARYAAIGRPSAAANLVHSLAFLYWGTAVAIGVALHLLAAPIAGNWLQSNGLPRTTIEHGVSLLGLVIACRWPIGLYQGVLMGSMRLSHAAGINMAMVTLANVGAIVVLATVSATVEAFFAWHALAGLMHALLTRHTAWRVLAPVDGVRFDGAELARIWRFAAGMGAIAVSGVALLQLDKVILSRLLALDDFGRYSVAGLVASGLYLVLMPTFNIIYPRMSTLVAQRDEVALTEFYRTGTRLLSAVLFPVAVTASMFSFELLALWTRNEGLARDASMAASILLLGTALNGAMHFPYALQLAFGATKLPLYINALLLAVMVPMTLLLAQRYGAPGGAAAWAILNLIYLLFGTWLTHRTLLRGLGPRWLTFDVLLPAGFAVAFVGLIGTEVRRLGLPGDTTFLIACVLAAVCSVALLAMSARTRNALRIAFPGSAR